MQVEEGLCVDTTPHVFVHPSAASRPGNHAVACERGKLPCPAAAVKAGSRHTAAAFARDVHVRVGCVQPCAPEDLGWQGP